MALLAGVVGLAALFGAPNAALAARSGGRVGGSSFSSRGSSSPSYSYSGGKHSAGMGAGWGSSRMAPSTTVIRTGTSVGFFPIAPTYGFYGGGFSFMSTATTLIIVAALVFVAAQVRRRPMETAWSVSCASLLRRCGKLYPARIPGTPRPSTAAAWAWRTTRVTLGRSA